MAFGLASAKPYMQPSTSKTDVCQSHNALRPTCNGCTAQSTPIPLSKLHPRGNIPYQHLLPVGHNRQVGERRDRAKRHCLHRKRRALDHRSGNAPAVQALALVLHLLERDERRGPRLRPAHRLRDLDGIRVDDAEVPGGCAPVLRARGKFHVHDVRAGATDVVGQAQRMQRGAHERRVVEAHPLLEPLVKLVERDAVREREPIKQP